MHTDLEKLRRIVNLPPGNFGCRWASAPVVAGGSGLPGPSDTRTYAFVALDAAAWTQLLPSGRDSSSKTIELSAPLARAVLPESSLVGARADGDRIAVTGTAVPGESLARLPYRVRNALKLTDGLLIELFTM